MVYDLIKALSNKDFLSAKGFLESSLQEKIASAVEDKRFEVVDKFFNQNSQVHEDTVSDSEDVLNEEKQKHVVLMTLSDPNHTAVSMRKTKVQRRATVTAADRESAINTAHAFYKKQGYKVHDHHYVGLKEEAELTLEDYSLEELQDFMMSEDFEQLDELSKYALQGYVSKAAISMYDKGLQRGSSSWKKTDGKKLVKRLVGIQTAAKKLAKEETDQDLESIDEAVSMESKARYEYSNGKKPSGKGNWMFSTVHPKDHDVTKHKDQTHSVHGTFSDASKAAAKHFKEKGHTGEIHVLS